MAELFDPMDTSLDDTIRRKRTFSNKRRHKPYGKAPEGNVDEIRETDFSTKTWREGRKSESSWRGGGYQSSRSSRSSRPRGFKVEISNIHWQIAESELKELFCQAGQLDYLALQFDSAGRSEGKAVAYYTSHQDASKAQEMYNHRLLDGLELEVVFEESKSSILTRLGPKKMDILDRLGSKGASKRGGRSGSGRRLTEKRGRVEDLDLELESYIENGQSEFDAKRALVSYADVN